MKKMMKKMKKKFSRKLLNNNSNLKVHADYNIDCEIVSLISALAKTLYKIKHYQKFTELLISRLSFQHVIKKICVDISMISDMRWQKTTIMIFQKTAEFFIIHEFESMFYYLFWLWNWLLIYVVANLLTIHGRRVTLQCRDMLLIRTLRSHMLGDGFAFHPKA